MNKKKCFLSEILKSFRSTFQMILNEFSTFDEIDNDLIIFNYLFYTDFN